MKGGYSGERGPEGIERGESRGPRGRAPAPGGGAGAGAAAQGDLQALAGRTPVGRVTGLPGLSGGA